MFSYETSLKRDEYGFEITEENPIVEIIDAHILYCQTQSHSCHDMLMLCKMKFQCAIVDLLTQPR